MTQQRAVPTFAPETLQQWFERRGGTTNPGGRRSSSGPTRSTTTSTRTSASRPSRCSRRPASRSSSREGTSAAAGRSTTSACSTWPSATSAAASTRCARGTAAGIPIVGLEPSCVAVFRDELGKLLPHDEDAKRLAQSTYHLAEFLEKDDVEPPRLERKAFVWGHCHHKATGGIDPEVELLEKMGVDVEMLNAGCCGMAGSLGFEAGHYDVSMAVRRAGAPPGGARADAETLVVADGFSCKTQIEQGSTGRRALHVAQVLKLAREHGASGPSGARARAPLLRGAAEAVAAAAGRESRRVVGAARSWRSVSSPLLCGGARRRSSAG